VHCIVLLYFTFVACLSCVRCPKVIKLDVVRLQLEVSSDCAGDRLAIYDGWTADGGAILARLCGVDLPARPYVTESNIAVLSFTSDDSGSDAGFSVDYQPLAADADPTDSATGAHKPSKFTRLSVISVFNVI